MVCIRTEDQNQMSFSPYRLREVSVLTELILGHPRYRFTDVPPQPNSPPGNVSDLDRSTQRTRIVSSTGPTRLRFRNCPTTGNLPNAQSHAICRLVLEYGVFGPHFYPIK